MPSELAQRIRKKRKELGLTQAELGALVGVNPLAVVNWESGTNRPWETIVPLARALEVSIEYLLTGATPEEMFVASAHIKEGDRDDISPVLRRIFIKAKTLREPDQAFIEDTIDHLLAKYKKPGKRQERTA